MLQKRKITRKRNREWRGFLKKISIFLICFGTTLTSLSLIFASDKKGFLSPLSLIKTTQGIIDMSSTDTSLLKKELKIKNIAYSDIKVSSEGAYMLKLKTGEDIILSPNKDLKRQLSSLQVITSRLTMEGRSLRKLDLRYDKPVVVFK